MRDSIGSHVSQTNEFGSQEDIDDIYVTTSVRGSFRIRYYDNVDRVCLDVKGPPFGGDMSMQLTLDQAELLRDLLDAGIADARAAKVIELPAGGDAA